MPAGRTDKIRPGQPVNSALSARVWNKMVDATEWVDRNRMKLGSTPAAMQARPVTVDVRNGSGGDWAAGSVVQLGALILDDEYVEKGFFWFAADDPDDAGAVHAILPKAIKSGKIGEAQLLGVCVARVNVNDVTHPACLIEASATELESAAVGPVRLLYAPDTGSQLCVVLLGEGIMEEHGTADESIAQDATGTISIGSLEIEAENHTGVTIEEGARVRVYVLRGVVYVEPLECST